MTILKNTANLDSKKYNAFVDNVVFFIPLQGFQF